jgi:hypothetical protein
MLTRSSPCSINGLSKIYAAADEAYANGIAESEFVVVG